MSTNNIRFGGSSGRSNTFAQQLRERRPFTCHPGVYRTALVLGGVAVAGVLLRHALAPLFVGALVVWLVVMVAGALLLDPLLSIRARWPSAVHRAGGSEYTARVPRIRLASLLANLRQGFRPASIVFDVENDSAGVTDLNEAGGEIARRLGWDRCIVTDCGNRTLRVQLDRVPDLDTRGPSWTR